MSKAEDARSFRHREPGFGGHHSWLLPALETILGAPEGRTIFEIGFGNGSIANQFAAKGFGVAGIEPSDEGVALAKRNFPHLTDLHQGSIYDDLPEKHDTFPIVLSLDVIEHLYAPRQFATAAARLLMPGGLLIVSTPYHGYLKNLAIALVGQFDRHLDPLWDHGHIKFWSMPTLSALLREVGFTDIRFVRAGRIPQLAKSMIAIARKGPR